MKYPTRPRTIADIVGIETPVDLEQTFRSWGIKKGDLHAGAVAERLHKLWSRWPRDRRAFLLQVAEEIATVERAKQAWNPKVHRPRHRTLAKVALNAGNLIHELVRLFPPPWTGAAESVGALIRDLAAFASASVTETSAPLNLDFDIRQAGDWMEIVRRGSAGKVPWELLAALAWLASGKRHQPSVRTVRRYLGHRQSKPLAEKVWSPHFRKLGTAVRKAGAVREEKFRAAVQAFLSEPA